MTRLSSCFGAIALAGCSIVTSVDGFTFSDDAGDSGATDAGLTDASVDAGTDAGSSDAGPACSMDCTPGYCAEALGMCAECLEDSHCDPTLPVCDTGGGTVPGSCDGCNVIFDECSTTSIGEVVPTPETCRTVA